MTEIEPGGLPVRESRGARLGLVVARGIAERTGPEIRAT
jgi:hypothetical protein